MAAAQRPNEGTIDASEMRSPSSSVSCPLSLRHNRASARETNPTGRLAVSTTIPARETGLLPSQYAAIASFRLELRRFLTFSEAAATEAGVPPQQHQALLAIAGHTPA
jgi:hypothetical protein